MIVVAAIAVLLLASVIGGDWLARRRRWRLGPWTQRFSRGKAWDITTSWGVIRIREGCSLIRVPRRDGGDVKRGCGTSWRYVDPHIITVNPYGQLEPHPTFCTKCHNAIPRSGREEAYLAWWLDRRDQLVQEADPALPIPDVREWEAIRTALRVEQSVNRVSM